MTSEQKRIAVVGASSGLGRSIAIDLGKRGHRVALLARRRERLTKAAHEAGNGAIAVVCDVTDPDSCQTATDEVLAEFGGLDTLVYSTGMGVLTPLAETTAEQWASLFATNVTGASLVTAAMLEHLGRSSGSAVYLSSLTAAYDTPWPLLGAYAVSKAALEKLVVAWRVEHPEVGFTSIAIGDCPGGEGDSTTEINKNWDPAVLEQAIQSWIQDGHLNGGLVDVEHLTGVVESVVRCGNSCFIPHLSVVARVQPAAAT
ncbi:short-chain dehydrogenase [Mycobacterium paraffinicum]|uniref:Short-chain dehydrogenase n=1 Tax=Mycobacterium paraffinicum TaxID=53378 RepID=A0A1Q4I286_9MYCO|nr:SDR family oxidoreductase [Mycobacterium paraffinicum]OJZ76092.1 short-chain dehydrogenase [Mycobacterium paraffinicum]